MANYQLYHKFDAHHAKNLGEDSVSDYVQGLLELGKNAYDGDATSCVITFVGKPDKLHGFLVNKIIIEDNGIGMSFYDIDQKWLKVGTSNKTKESFSPLLKRQVVGEKGMGHFACQKLADRITIISNPMNYRGRGSKGDKLVSEEEKLVHINKTIILDQDWTKYKSGEDFGKIPNDAQVIPREIPEGQEPNKVHGLKIELSKLRQKWTKEDIERFRISLKSLVKPGPVKEDSTTDFKPILDTKSLGIEEPQEEKSWLEFAPYKVKAKLRGKKLSWEFSKRSKDGRKKMEQFSGSMSDSKWVCGDLDVELYHYPKSGSIWHNFDALPKFPTGVNAAKVNKWLRENQGIKIWKDGIRVMPYGESGNDWLELEKRYGNRSKDSDGIPHLRNAGIVGFVLLSKENNPGINETATRREIDNTAAFKSLAGDNFAKNREESIMIRLIHETLEKNFLRIDRMLKKSKGEIRDEPAIAINRTKQLLASIRKLTPEVGEDVTRAMISDVNSIGQTIQEIQRTNEIEVRDLESMEEMYRGLAAFGITTSSLEHHIGLTLKSFGHAITDLKYVTAPEHQHIIERLNEELTYLIEWRKYVKGFATVMQARGNMGDFARTEINFAEMTSKLKKNLAGALVYDRGETIKDVTRIKLEFQPIGELKKIYANPLDFDAIFACMITNSIKALSEVESTREEYKIIIKVWKEHGKLKISFYDNGLGIKEEDWEQIFKEYVSIHDNPLMKGMGLGLPIVRDIVSVSYDGDFKLDKTIDDDEKPGEGETTFMLEIPLKNLQ